MLQHRLRIASCVRLRETRLTQTRDMQGHRAEHASPNPATNRCPQDPKAWLLSKLYSTLFLKFRCRAKQQARVPSRRHSELQTHPGVKEILPMLVVSQMLPRQRGRQSRNRRWQAQNAEDAGARLNFELRLCHHWVAEGLRPAFMPSTLTMCSQWPSLTVMAR